MSHACCALLITTMATLGASHFHASLHNTGRHTRTTCVGRQFTVLKHTTLQHAASLCQPWAINRMPSRQTPLRSSLAPVLALGFNAPAQAELCKHKAASIAPNIGKNGMNTEHNLWLREQGYALALWRHPCPTTVRVQLHQWGSQHPPEESVPVLEAAKPPTLFHALAGLGGATWKDRHTNYETLEDHSYPH